jgi:hypothetical protein
MVSGAGLEAEGDSENSQMIDSEGPQFNPEASNQHSQSRHTEISVRPNEAPNKLYQPEDCRPIADERSVTPK